MQGFVLREYQTTAYNEILNNMNNGINTVLAAGTGAGKTVIAAFLADTLSKAGKRVLILTHGQTLLKTQWFERLTEMGIVFSENDTKKVGIVVGLPQSIKNIESLNFDYIIVDEAHEFYYAEKMVQAIIKKAKPKALLCLTATPSKFIRNGGFDIKVISALELYQQGYLTDLYFGLFSTDIKFKKLDYNDNNDLKSSFKFKEAYTLKAMNSLLDEMHKRLTAVFNKSNPSAYKFTKNFPTLFGKLEKTMIACHSIDQAKFIKKYLENKKISTCLSESETDIDSLEIEKFKNDKNALVLIVVNRGVLGFDFPELVNVVDMTGTLNINRIFQLYGRVLRKDPNNPSREKFYFKLAPQNEIELYRIYLQAAIHLMEKSFVSRYNGKNLDEMEVAIIREKIKSSKGVNISKKNSSKNIKSIDKFFLDTVCAQNILIDLWSKKGYSLDEVSFTKMSIIIGKIKEINITLYSVYGTDVDSIVNAIKNFKNENEWRNSL